MKTFRIEFLTMNKVLVLTEKELKEQYPQVVIDSWKKCKGVIKFEEVKSEK